jgi:hypothetical protein
MKIAAAILATLTIFMTAQGPMLSTEASVSEENCPVESSCSVRKSTCTKEVPVPENENKSKCCDYNFCNPFGACCCYTSVERPLLSVTSFFIQTKIANPVNENTLSSYIQDVWHPPKPGSLT